MGRIMETSFPARWFLAPLPARFTTCVPARIRRSRGLGVSGFGIGIRPELGPSTPRPKSASLSAP